MEAKEAKKMLDDVIYTLNLIDVRGEDNLNRVLGCIQTLKLVSSDFSKNCVDRKPVVE